MLLIKSLWIMRRHVEWSQVTSSIMEESCLRMLIPCQAGGNFIVVPMGSFSGPVLVDIFIKGLNEHTDDLPIKSHR